MKLYQAIASTIQARENCVKSGNSEWFDKHTEKLKVYAKLLPSGSGFDAGSTLDLDKSTPEKLVISTAFHHMNETGYYDGWTEHVVTVTPSLAFGFDLKVSGENRNDIKDYIAELFHDALHFGV